jgi:uncharacterized protein
MLPALGLLVLALVGPQDERKELAGWYELEPGRPVVVTFGASGGLRLFDFARPSFDVLAPAATGFTWRRQSPAAEGRLTFTRTEDKVAGFEWSFLDGTHGSARRDDELGWTQQEVRFPSGEGSAAVELCGLLMLPRGLERADVALPGAVFLQGSGDSDRDNVWAFSIAHHLAQHGIAVLLPDKRGCGQSRGDWKAVGFEELAADARAAFRVLAARPGVDPRRVGFVGLSQGGWIAPLAARGEARASYAVSVSSAAVTVREQVLHELEWNLRPTGGEEAVAIALELMGMAFEFGRTGAGFEDYLAGVEAAPPALAGAFPTARDDWRWSWYARVLDFDPVPLWRELRIPTLVVYGAEDEHDNVPVAKSRERLGALGRADLLCRVYAGSGHALDDPQGNWIRRDFLDELVGWIRAAPAR